MYVFEIRWQRTAGSLDQNLAMTLLATLEVSVVNSAYCYCLDDGIRTIQLTIQRLDFRTD